MKKWYLVLITLAIETILLWLVSITLGWSLLNTAFLGGIVVFGCAWFYHFCITPRTMEYNANKKDWIDQDTEIIKPFQFIMSPVTQGFLIFTVVSFILTMITYYPYI